VFLGQGRLHTARACCLLRAEEMAKSARDEQIFVSASSARSVVFPLSRTLMRPHYLVMIRYGSLGQPRAEGCRRWDKGRSMTGDRVRWRPAQHVSKTRHESCQRIRRRSRFLPLLVVGPVLFKPRQADRTEKISRRFAACLQMYRLVLSLHIRCI
jgi:hypothetical protein